MSHAGLVGLEERFSPGKQAGWRRAEKDHGRRASHHGEGKGAAFPQCHPMLYGAHGGIKSREGWPAMGPAWREGAMFAQQPPPAPTAWSCPGAWPNLHTKDDGLLPALCNFVLTPQGDASPPSPLLGCTRAGWVPSSEGLEMGCLWVHLAPLIPRLWEAFCACHLSHMSREHLC